MTGITDERWVQQQADTAANAIEQARAALLTALDGESGSTLPADLVRALVTATDEEPLNFIRDAAFREGVTEFKEALMSYEWHPQSTGVWHPYARIEGYSHYGCKL